MCDSPAAYIRTVQHLIEKCLIFHMSKEQCMDALSKHANIKPIITSTVWRELEKENREFFDAYEREREREREERASEMQRVQTIEKAFSSAFRGSCDEVEDEDDK